MAETSSSISFFGLKDTVRQTVKLRELLCPPALPGCPGRAKDLAFAPLHESLAP